MGFSLDEMLSDRFVGTSARVTGRTGSLCEQSFAAKKPLACTRQEGPEKRRNRKNRVSGTTREKRKRERNLLLDRAVHGPGLFVDLRLSFWGPRDVLLQLLLAGCQVTESAYFA